MTQSTSESIHELVPIFSDIFTRDALKEIIAEMDIKMYWRAYTPLIMLWGFLYQRLNADHTCDSYVAYLHSGKADRLDAADEHEQSLSQRLRSESNAGYVQGRNRFPTTLLQKAAELVNKQLQRWLADERVEQARAVRFLDGTTFTLAPLGDLAATYGHSSNQHGEHQWVKVRAVASFDLHSQAMTGLREAPYAVGETSMVLPVLQSDPEPGALYIGDRNFGVYRVVQALHAAEKEGLLRLQKQQWQALMRRNGIDRLRPGESCPCVWQPSRKDTLLEAVPAPTIAGRLVHMRIVKAGFRPLDIYLFTTLQDEERYPVEALAELYARRYAVAEGGFRHLKTTMQMDKLCVRSAAMFRKELAAGLLAYNLICALMVRAAQLSQLQVTALSFAQVKRRLYHALFDGLPTWIHTVAEATLELYRRLFACQLPSRQQKVQYEPRRKRYRWHRYPPLTTDRHTARLVHLKNLQEADIS